MPDTSIHPPESLLIDFALGRCEAADLDELEAHIQHCGRCLAFLERQEADDSFIRRIRGGLADMANGPGGEDDVEPGRGGGPVDADVVLDRIGDYRIIRRIGSGGMGTVYEAEHLALRRRVALKVLRTVASDDPRMVARFRRETLAVSQLHHTNIVPLLDAGRDRGYCFYSMPLIMGRGLDQLLDDLGRPRSERIGGGAARTRESEASGPHDPRRTGGGDPAGSADGPSPALGILEALQPPSRSYDRTVARLTLQAAQALAYAHDRGIVHRDIKPSNLLLDDEGAVWITDFGLARWTAADDDLTASGETLGTLRYLAPECFDGRADERSDLYSLGLTLYELLTIRPAFAAAGGPELIRQVLEGALIAPRVVRPGISRDLETIVLKAVAREPMRRFASAQELADDLRRFLAGEPIRSRPLSLPGRAWRWARRRPAVAGLIAALSGTMLAGTAVSIRFAQVADRRAAEAVRARERAQGSERNLGRTSAELLLDQGVRLAQGGRVEEGLHWMIAALGTTADADSCRLARVHLATWGARIPTLTHWLDTAHRQAAFSRDGRQLVTTGPSGDDLQPTAWQLWRLDAGRRDGPPMLSADRDVRSPALSPDGRTLLAGNGSIQLYQFEPGWATRWDVAGRHALGRVTGHRDCVLATAWSPDGCRFYTGSRDRTVIAWHAATGLPAGAPLPHPAEVRAISPSPDGRWLLTLTPNSAHIWDNEAGSEVVTPFAIPGATLLQGAFAADGRSFLISRAAHDGLGYRILRQAWDGTTGRAVDEPSEVHRDNGSIAPLPDGRFLAGATVDPSGTWSIRRNAGIQLSRRPMAESLCPDEVELSYPAPAMTSAVARPDPATSAFFVPVPNQPRLARRVEGDDSTPPTTIGHAPLFGRTRLALAPNGRLVATVPGGADKDAVQVYRADDGRPLGGPLPQRHAVWAMAFDADSRRLATGGLAHEVTVWDVEHGTLLAAPLPHGDIIQALEFSPTDGTLAVGTWNGEVRLWDRALSPVARSPLRHPDRVLRVHFNGDGSRLAVVCGWGVTLWDPRSGRKVATLSFTKPADPQREEVDPEAMFSPDGRVLLASPGFGSFRLWDARTGVALGPPTPMGRSHPPLFAFSPDGSLLLVGDDTGSAQLWEVASTRQFGAPSVQPPALVGVAFLDAKAYQTVAADGSIRRWTIPEAITGTVETIAQSIALATGLRRDDANAIVPLQRSEWQALRDRWEGRNGAASWAVSPPIAPEAWHRARLRDAEQTGNRFAAWWHADRLRRDH